MAVRQREIYTAGAKKDNRTWLSGRLVKVSDANKHVKGVNEIVK